MSSHPRTIQREEVLEMIRRGKETSSQDYVLIDLRRNDHEVQSPPTLPA